jgi:hypothetical protein
MGNKVVSPTSGIKFIDWKEIEYKSKRSSEFVGKNSATWVQIVLRRGFPPTSGDSIHKLSTDGFPVLYFFALLPVYCQPYE